jgi:S-adenosylmethionine uptake transporter
MALHPGIIFLFMGAVLFALSDILNKKMLASESLFSLLFYFYLGTTLISFIPALLVWKQMNLEIVFYLLVQAIGGISILYCILKAADATEISSIAPYKYIELVFSIIIGYALFNEVIKISTIAGASLIIPGALLIAYYEINQERKSSSEEIMKLAEVKITESDT